MKIDRIKVKKAFKKALIGVKSGYNETSKFVKTYGPPTHNYLKNMSSGIGETFEINKPRNQVSFKVRPMGRFPGLKRRKSNRGRYIDFTRPKSKVDFNNLGVRY